MNPTLKLLAQVVSKLPQSNLKKIFIDDLVNATQHDSFEFHNHPELEAEFREVCEFGVQNGIHIPLFEKESPAVGVGGKSESESESKAKAPKFDKHFGEFSHVLYKRLEQGAKEYGDESFTRPPSELLGELSEEALDIVGWGFLLWVRLREFEKKVGE